MARAASRADHHTQVTHASLDNISRDLQRADRLKVFVERLHNQQLEAFGAGILDRANCGAVDTSEKHGLFRPDIIQHAGDDRFQQLRVDLISEFCLDRRSDALAQGLVIFEARWRLCWRFAQLRGQPVVKGKV
jgi:hypothetical protein